MEKVTGIGGVFIRSSDPDALAAWYTTHLGIDTGMSVWAQPAGPTVFAPFRKESDYFPTSQQVMLNLRVADMDAMTAQLRAAGIAVETRSEWDEPEIGRFARIHDPDGNAIELWEPA
ncbi:VOC family protein [Phaeobacter sp. J2-8]|uniref:VOC family protein n=1 Tax=Phaeobacter sp. J2-8 TaxID=2931394 RepID=UPI001FD0DB80|nr:VOC family protein [Phaeobacter sp. J2-8]MCJ7872618.1 VOC family protein [Phaeobacter sp. J2-8]